MRGRLVWDRLIEMCQGRHGVNVQFDLLTRSNQYDRLIIMR